MQIQMAILDKRRAQHQAGLDLMVQPIDGFPRQSHKVGEMKQKIHPVATEAGLAFLDRMKVIEEEFMSGIRKGG